MLIPKHNDDIPIHESFNLHSQYTNELVTVNVWFPEIYKNNSCSLPVLYMLDGGLKESFPFMANMMQHLILNNKIPNYILVGIINTNRNKNLTTLTTQPNDLKWVKEYGGFEAFSNFICLELIPVINQKYRTTQINGIIGESLAGLFVLQMFLNHNFNFKYYIALDPSVWWNNHKIISDFELFFKLNQPNNKHIWFASSKVKNIQTYTNVLAEILKNKAVNWQYSIHPTENHFSIFRNVSEQALIWTLNQ